MIKELFFIGIMCVISFIIGFNRSNVYYQYHNITEYKTNETVCITYLPKIINMTVRQYEPVPFIVKYNVSEDDLKAIKNARVPCKNIGCGEGAIRMKYEILDILGVKRPTRFSERPSTTFFQDDLTTVYLPIGNKSDSLRIKLPSSDWFVLEGSKTYNKSYICDENTTKTGFRNNTLFSSSDRGENISLYHI